MMIIDPKRPDHLFMGVDGNLYDTRRKNWSAKPLRENFHRGHRRIRNTTDLKATLRHGEYAWPGGYQMFFITSDGAALSFKAVEENLRDVLDAINRKDNNGWRVVACDINYEDEDLYCAHTSEKIPSCYGGE
jgi:hypothetical protein